MLEIQQIFNAEALSFYTKLGGWLKKLCDVDPKELDCPSGQKPRLFKGSDCSSITDGDEFPKTKENKCADADDVSNNISKYFSKFAFY